MEKNSRWLKERLLFEYEEKNPHAYYQFDSRIRPNREPDEELDAIVIPSATFELKEDIRLRVLISPGVTQIEALLMLKEIRGLIKLEGFRESESNLSGEIDAIDQLELQYQAENIGGKNESDNWPF